MAKEILIKVRDKIAERISGEYVCGNSDFVAVFDLDEEWGAYDTKTARIDIGDEYFDIVFNGNQCAIPILSDIHSFYIGVFAGNLKTTTSAYVPARKSILCKSGSPAAPSEDVYAQIMELINAEGGEGTITVENGMLCETVEAVTVSGEGWRQIEILKPVDEPYLQEWGWLCCDDHEKEIYRWLYRCMLEGLGVQTRTIEINNNGIYSFATDGKKIGVEEITMDIIARKDFVAPNGSLIPAGTNIVNSVMPDQYVTFLRIPVVQFQIADEIFLYTIAQRVMMDNPLLLFSFFPSVLDSVAAIKDENGIIQYIYSVVPTEEKRCQAWEICNEQIGKIIEKVYELYGIMPNDKLTVAQKAKVCKVIHDYLVLIGNQEGETFAWWLYTPYSVFDRRYKGLCTSYTMAFCAVARLYGIEAVNMTGFGYINKDNSVDGSYEVSGEHSWIAVRLSDDEYGTYPSDPEVWSCIDAYWDEPIQEIKNGGDSDRDDIVWKYFLNLPEINIISDGAEKAGHSYRTIDASIAYGALPIDGIPSLSMPYSGNKVYIWEDEL